MAELNRKMAAQLVVPPWASFFTLSQYVDFERLIGEDLKGRGCQYMNEDGVAVVRFSDGRVERVGLLNLAQLCHRDPPARWPRLIQDFFSSCFRSTSEISHLLGDLMDLNKVRERIKLRLHGSEYVRQPGGRSVATGADRGWGDGPFGL